MSKDSRSSINNEGAMKSHRDAAHKAAIALNNSAVSLLSLGYHQDAVSTLEDAVVLMGAAMVQVEHPSLLSTVTSTTTAASTSAAPMLHSSEEDIQLALERSSLRAALSGVCSNNNHVDAELRRNSGTATATSTAIPLQIISSMLNPTRVYETLTSCADSAAVKVSFPMKIDPIDFERYTMDDVNFEAGVILYNYGVAHDCLATAYATNVAAMFTTAEDLCEIARLRSQAHHYYKCAGLVLYKIDQDCCQVAPIALASQLLLLRTVLTHNLLNVSIQLNLPNEYSEYCQAMLILLHYVEAQHAFLPIEDQNVAAAA